jgi:peptidyl-prolyl cis-trans isomerase D
MLDVLRRSASSWVAKLLLLILVVSFGAWGIADVFNRGGPDTVAQVGTTKISARDFSVAWRREFEALQRQTNGTITRDQAITYGLPDRVTARMITDAAIEQEARQLGLGVSDAETDRLIASDPSLRLPGGGFDPGYAKRILEANGWTSVSYFQYLKREAIRQQLIGAAAAPVPPPTSLVEFAERYVGEERKIGYFVLGDDAAGTIETPSAETLAAFYDANKSGFRTVETRTIQVSLLRPEDVAKPETISDADARAYLNEHPELAGQAEERRVEQLPFDDEAAANAAAAELAAGKSFDDLLKARKLASADVDLGMMPKTGFIDPAVGEAAFALAAPGAVSGVIKTRFKPVILRLAEVKPGKTATFEELAPHIKEIVAKGRAVDAIAAKRDEIEDVRAGGTKLVEIAKQFGMTPPSTVTLDRNGNGKDGKPVDLPELQRLARAAFATDVGNEAEPVSLPGGGLAYLEIESIDAAHEQALADVRDAVAERWRQEQIRTRVLTRANELANAVRAGTPLAEAAARVGASVAEAGPFRRDAVVEPLSTNAVAAAFGGPQELVAVTTAKDGGRVVLQVTDVTEPVFLAEAADTKAMADNLGNDMRNTIVDQMVRRLRSEYGVTINQALIQQIVGSGG